MTQRNVRNVREERRWAGHDPYIDEYRVFPKKLTRKFAQDQLCGFERLVRVTILVPKKEKK